MSDTERARSLQGTDEDEDNVNQGPRLKVLARLPIADKAIDAIASDPRSSHKKRQKRPYPIGKYVYSSPLTAKQKVPLMRLSIAIGVPTMISDSLPAVNWSKSSVRTTPAICVRIRDEAEIDKKEASAYRYDAQVAAHLGHDDARRDAVREGAIIAHKRHAVRGKLAHDNAIIVDKVTLVALRR